MQTTKKVAQQIIEHLPEQASREQTLFIRSDGHAANGSSRPSARLKLMTQ
ncbi:hypothetical protein RM530_07945 [Algiphilus sp. W345]|uniref:Uncharacterized protein n=1 Tax=Banduia mediterranea TaxID=3075609 RepID=A0ABU2WJ26_9GAMM|nr:hypothetical protein [Algiphilus sp. W345]MDT0497296.1 hypothetical protein [Algiphilus sp. W345]